MGVYIIVYLIIHTCVCYPLSLIGCGFSDGSSCFEQRRSFFEQGKGSLPALSLEAECGEGSAESHHTSQGGDDGR